MNANMPPGSAGRLTGFNKVPQASLLAILHFFENGDSACQEFFLFLIITIITVESSKKLMQESIRIPPALA